MNVNKSSVETIKLTIPNISCMHCVNTINMELSELNGVIEVISNVNNKTTQVTYKPPANKDVIIDLLEQINYPPEK